MSNRSFICILLVHVFFQGNFTFAQNDKSIFLSNNKKEVNCICFSDRGSYIYFNEGNNIYFKNLRNESENSIFKSGHKKKILSLDISKDSSKIISGGQDSLIILWDNKGEIIRKLDFHKGIITSVRFDISGNYIYSGATDRRIVCYNIPLDSIIFNIEVFKDDIITIDISEDGKLLAAGGANGEIYILNSWNGSVIANLKNPGWVRCVRFNDNSSILATCCDDGKIYFWDLHNLVDIKMVWNDKLSNDWITSMDFFPDNKSYSYSTVDGIIGISIHGNIDRFKIKSPVLMVKNRPGLGVYIEIAVATSGNGLEIINGSVLMTRKN
jgi:WD40 repeat protein